MFYTKRYAAASGLNSTNLDFLPVRNVEDVADVAIGGVMAAVPVGKHADGMVAVVTSLLANLLCTLRGTDV